MAVISNKSTGEQIRLLRTHIFGRQSDVCNTHLHHTDVSRLHATILWDGERWQLRDASTNGTYINGKLINSGNYIELKKGDGIQFGNNSSNCWELSCTENPNTMLIPLQPGLPYLDVHKIIALPSEENPAVVITESVDGHWICESEAGLAVLKSGDLVGSGSSLWRFIEAKPLVATHFNPKVTENTVENLKLVFCSSQNEEHVRLTLQLGEEAFDLGERIHHYLLLVLARQRIADNQRGLATAEQGWIEKDLLCKMLGTDVNHINIQHFRLRKQLADAMPKYSQQLQLIESRVGQLRIGCDKISI